MTRSALLHEIGDRGAGRIDRPQRRAELGRQALQRLMRAVDHGDGSAHADRDRRRMRARHAAAEDEHIGRRHARHAAEQHAAPALRLLQRMRPDLRREAPRDLRHRRQQRQAAIGAGHRLIGDAGRARGHEVARLLEIGREMQVGEQDLPALQPLALFRQRLLDLHDHLGLREDIGPGRDDLGAGADIFLIRRPGADAGRSLDDHLMSVMDEFGDRGRGHADPEFVVLDFLGNADEHGPHSETALKTDLRRLSQEIRRRDTRFGSSPFPLL